MYKLDNITYDILQEIQDCALLKTSLNLKICVETFRHWTYLTYLFEEGFSSLPSWGSDTGFTVLGVTQAIVILSCVTVHAILLSLHT